MLIASFSYDAVFNIVYTKPSTPLQPQHHQQQQKTKKIADTTQKHMENNENEFQLLDNK